MAILHRDRFRVDGQIRHLPRRPGLREVYGGSDQAKYRRCLDVGFRDGSRQRRAIFVIVAAPKAFGGFSSWRCYFCALRVIIEPDATRLPLFALSRYLTNVL